MEKQRERNITLSCLRHLIVDRSWCHHWQDSLSLVQVWVCLHQDSQPTLLCPILYHNTDSALITSSPPHNWGSDMAMEIASSWLRWAMILEKPRRRSIERIEFSCGNRSPLCGWSLLRTKEMVSELFQSDERKMSMRNVKWKGEIWWIWKNMKEDESTYLLWEWLQEVRLKGF